MKAVENSHQGHDHTRPHSKFQIWTCLNKHEKNLRFNKAQSKLAIELKSRSRKTVWEKAQTGFFKKYETEEGQQTSISTLSLCRWV